MRPQFDSDKNASPGKIPKKIKVSTPQQLFSTFSHKTFARRKIEVKIFSKLSKKEHRFASSLFLQMKLRMRRSQILFPLQNYKSQKHNHQNPKINLPSIKMQRFRQKFQSKWLNEMDLEHRQQVFNQNSEKKVNQASLTRVWVASLCLYKYLQIEIRLNDRMHFQILAQALNLQPLKCLQLYHRFKVNLVNHQEKML